MSFFTTSYNTAENFLNPTPGQTNSLVPGAGPMSSSMNINPAQIQSPFFTPGYSQVQNQQQWGAPTGGVFNEPRTTGLPMNNSNLPWYLQQQYQPQITPRGGQQPTTQKPFVDTGSDYVDEGSPPPMTQEDMNFWGLNNIFGGGANQLDSSLDGLNNSQNNSGGLFGGLFGGDNGLFGTGMQLRDLIPGAGIAHLMNSVFGPAHPEAVVDNPVGIQQNSNYNWNTASPNTSSVIADRQANNPVLNAGGGIDNSFGLDPYGSGFDNSFATPTPDPYNSSVASFFGSGFDNSFGLTPDPYGSGMDDFDSGGGGSDSDASSNSESNDTSSSDGGVFDGWGGDDGEW